MSEKLHVGFSQRIQLEWLNYTAELVLAGHEKKQIRAELDKLLKNKLSIGGDDSGNNRSKAISILLKTWVTVAEPLEAFHADGLAFLQAFPKTDWLPVQWGMLVAVFPFFGSVAETVGRLQRLQGGVAAVQVQRRIREQFGERETTARAARRVLRSFIDWGVLTEAGKKGEYQAAPPRLVQYSSLAVWLLEALLRSSNTSGMGYKILAQSPVLFAFELPSLSLRDLENNPRLDVFRQGLDEDVVRLRADRHEAQIGVGLPLFDQVQ